jgi:hypothetical protein
MQMLWLVAVDVVREGIPGAYADDEKQRRRCHGEERPSSRLGVLPRCCRE